MISTLNSSQLSPHCEKTELDHVCGLKRWLNQLASLPMHRNGMRDSCFILISLLFVEAGILL